MNGAEDKELRRRWFPICGPDDLPEGHVFETQLLDSELAVWRSRHGPINVWANRCPHRGMRLTVGANLGHELRCAYHGYRFAEGSGQCTSVPAQPDRLPPKSLCATVFPVYESAGLIWTRLAAESPGSLPPAPSDGAATSLRAVVVAAPALAIGAILPEYRFRQSAAIANADRVGESCTTAAFDAYGCQSVAVKNQMTSEVRLFTQPIDARTTVIHGILLGELAERLRIPVLRHHAEQFASLRARIEGAERGRAA